MILLFLLFYGYHYHQKRVRCEKILKRSASYLFVRNVAISIIFQLYLRQTLEKMEKMKIILTTAIFLIWSICALIVTITPQIDIDASVILATETAITTNVVWKINVHIRSNKYRVKPSTISNIRFNIVYSAVFI